MLMLAWLPMIVPALGIFIFEYSSTEPQMQRGVSQMLRGPLQRPDLAAGCPDGSRFHPARDLVHADPDLFSLPAADGDGIAGWFDCADAGFV